MKPILPNNFPSSISLADVLKSCFLTFQAKDNLLKLPAVQSCLFVLVDGLGAKNLQDYSGHARKISAQKSRVISTVFPSTTAAALASLTTSTSPAQHGIMGYSLFDIQSGAVKNQLSGWDEKTMVPERWQSQPTLFQQFLSEFPSAVVADSKYKSSGFTRAVLRGADFFGADDLTARFQKAIQLMKSYPMVYLYISELDSAGHRHGIGSPEWLTQLEAIDQEYDKAQGQLPKNSGSILSSDHGMVNVSAEHKIFLDRKNPLLDGASSLAGEPRGLQLHYQDSKTKQFFSEQQLADLVSKWREEYSEQAWVLSKAELLSTELLGKEAVLFPERLGDIFVLAKADYAFYPYLDTSGSKNMIGQHGSITEAELAIPLVLSGNYQN